MSVGEVLSMPFMGGALLATKKDEEIKLIKYQAILIIGPAIFSPVVVVASVVQILAGCVFALAGKIKEAFTGSESELCKRGVSHLRNGGVDLAYSILNICTLGISGLIAFLIYDFKPLAC